MAFTDNFGHPKGLLGRLMLVSMDKEHLPMIGCIYTTLMALIFAGIDYALLYFLMWK